MWAERRALQQTSPIKTTTGFAHVRLTVTDIARSRAFYDQMFGWDVAYEVPAGADDATKEALGFLFGGLIYAVPGGLLGLRPVALGGDVFSEDRVGLDHLSLLVGAKSDLEDAMSQLDAVRAPHGDIKDLGGAWILELRDPENIALELYALKS